MEQKLNDNIFNKSLEITVPEFSGLSEEIRLDMTYIYQAEHRLVEAKTVNPSTYSELSYCFNEAYRNCKKHLSTLGYQKVRTERQLERERARIVLDVIPEKLKEVGKGSNNADFRNAIIVQDVEHTKCQERVDMLNALIVFMEGRIKVFENVCRHMNKELDIVIRSGTFDSNKYITQKY
jgi:hypothetical protein